MSEEELEALSAFLDGELEGDSAHRAIDAVLADEHLRRTWGAWHLIGESLRETRVTRVPRDLRAAIGAALRAESTPAAPRARRWRLERRPLAGLALAASVAAVAIIGIRALEPDGSPAPARVARAALDGDGTTIAPEAPSADPRATRLTWNDPRPAVEARLNGYLVNHNENVASGMRGLLPYARLVAYDGRN